ncbi:MAG: hypothetical protein GX053_07110 [Tissierella sp.]|nr:hypothetical protein [Tissierella sp.]
MIIYLMFFILVLSSTAIVFKKDISFAKLTSTLALGLSAIAAVFLMVSAIREDGFQALGPLICVFFTLIGFLIIWSSTSTIDYEIESRRIPIYYSLILLLISSLCGIVFFNNILLVFIFIELSAFLASAIVMIKNAQENYRAGLKYLFLSIFASAFLLVGGVILYRLAGTLNIQEMILVNSNINLLRYSFIFIFIGVALKSALFPFHIWLPDAHGSAPSTSSAILSALVIKGYIIFFIKLIYIGFGIELVKDLDILPINLVLGACAMIYGSVLAILQKNLKNMIAYSSVAQIGYIYLGIGLGTPLGLVASIFHIIAHGITKACLFLSAGRIISSTGCKEIKELNGIGKALPVTMFLYTICGFSMIGIPLFVGFLSKWNFAQAAISADNIWLILVLTVSSLLNGIYYLPIAIKAFFAEDESKRPKILLEPKGQLPVTILGVLIIITGIVGSPLIDLLTNIVQRLI